MAKLKNPTQRMTAAQYRALINIGREKQSKYRNKKTTVDGINFDSEAEANRYCELKLLQQRGEIQGFGLQPSFVLTGGVRYRPDFIVSDANGRIWVEDVKGMETKDFKIKRKLWETCYPWIPLILIKRR